MNVPFSSHNYSIVHSYARLVNAPDNTSPLCVSIYQFISSELRLVLGSYNVDRELAIHRERLRNAEGMRSPAA